jgi:hypothetical protein
VTIVSLADRFRELADNMTQEIQDKNRPRLENTYRRANIAASIRADARALELLQSKLRALADAHDAGSVPPELLCLKAKAHISYVLRFEQAYRDCPKEIPREQYVAIRSTLLALGDRSAGQVTPQDRIRQMERDLIGSKIPGFFPTPANIVSAMLELADIQPGDTVLEPSAGKGNVADRVRERHPDATLECVERHASLRSILQVKGHTVTSYDFMEHTGEYDVIVMNPPFELFQDIKHVRRAWDLLRSGGRLVSVMSESPFFRQDKIAVEFRGWLEERGALVIPLPEGAFKESNTSVRTRLVVLDKDGAAPAEAPDEQPTAAPTLPEDRFQFALPGTGAPDKRIPWRQLKMF